MIIAGDYLLYEGVLFVRRHGNLRIEVGMDASITVHRVFENQKEFEVLINKDKVVDTGVCLPMASEPHLGHNISKCQLLLYDVASNVEFL